MLKIRFQRVGKKNRPYYRLVLTDSRSAAKKKAKEILGFRDPLKKTESIDAEKVKYWLSVGAQVSDTAHNFLVKQEIISGPKIPVHKKSKKPAETKEEAKSASGVEAVEQIQETVKIEAPVSNAVEPAKSEMGTV